MLERVQRISARRCQKRFGNACSGRKLQTNASETDADLRPKQRICNRRCSRCCLHTVSDMVTFLFEHESRTSRFISIRDYSDAHSHGTSEFPALFEMILYHAG
jgi:hypothetical protein